LSTETTFAGASNQNHNDLINSIADVTFEDVKREFASAAFVAVLLDETVDITNKSQF
jgi:hypothetical protein